MPQTYLPDPPAQIPGSSGDRYLGPAVVRDVDGDAGRVLVEFPQDLAGGDPDRWAEMATDVPGGVSAGQRVLVTVGDDGLAYLIGVLGPASRRIESRDGATATVVRDDEGERIEVRDADDQLLFEYDPARKAARLNLPEGDLDVSAPRGNLTFAAGGAVRVLGNSIDLAASSVARMTVRDSISEERSSLRLDSRSTRLASGRMRLDAERTLVNMGEGRLTGSRLDTNVSRIRTTADRIHTEADSVTERFGALYQRITGLLQTRAGRLRTLVSGAWHGRAERADLRTSGTFKVDGERIHLG